MKAVIYARYSSDSQREESIEGQLRECTEYAERNGITILRSYIDRALSARTADRPEFQNMIKDSEQKLFDVVLIWKLDRFSRDRYDSAHYKRILKKNGVKVVSVKENISDGPEGIILESMLEGYAEYYSAELSEKIQRGQKENALKCKNNGGNTPLGYVVGADGVLAVDLLTAPLVTEIFSLRSLLLFHDLSRHKADSAESRIKCHILCRSFSQTSSISRRCTQNSAGKEQQHGTYKQRFQHDKTIFLFKGFSHDLLRYALSGHLLDIIIHAPDRKHDPQENDPCYYTHDKNHRRLQQTNQT